MQGVQKVLGVISNIRNPTETNTFQHFTWIYLSVSYQNDIRLFNSTVLTFKPTARILEECVLI